MIVHDALFNVVEHHLGYYLYELAQPYVKKDFEEFHAADLLAGNAPFENVKRGEALEMFKAGIATVLALNIPIVYGAVDLNRLWATNYATAKPVDMAFRMCLKLIEEWFREKAADGLGLLISDDSEKATKHEMSNAFHLFRSRVVSSPPQRGTLEHLHDDMYFGASKYSKGIQLADLCTLLIGRHLAGYSDTEDLYQRMSENIFKGSIEPA